MNYTENVIVPERTLLVSLDTGEYDAEAHCDDDAEAPLSRDRNVCRQRHGGGNAEFLREQ